MSKFATGTRPIDSFERGEKSLNEVLLRFGQAVNKEEARREKRLAAQTKSKTAPRRASRNR